MSPSLPNGPTLFTLGSLNIDIVYHVPHIVSPGETLSAHRRLVGAGGKGLNQSVAAARAGAHVCHLGMIGSDGTFLPELLATHGVQTQHVETMDTVPTGHAIIQVADSGENAIALFPGANLCIDETRIRNFLESSAPGDWFLTQNETSCFAEALGLASARGMRIAWNPAPMSPGICDLALDAIDLLVLNETESMGLCGESNPQLALAKLRSRAPSALLVLTLGAEGALVSEPGTSSYHHARPPLVQPIDTTAAGDTFVGYLLASLMQGQSVEAAAARACHAAAISTTRSGAADSIPQAHEVDLLHHSAAEFP